jgi:transglutaminase TgpA-like protein/transglutaminase superfamily protein
MASQQDASAGRQRLVATAAVAALAVATAFAFGRVFVGRVPTLSLIAAALVSVLIAGVCERRGLGLSLLASAIGLAFALTWILYPQTGWYGLPTLRTLRAVGRSLEFVAEQAKVQVAPTPPLAPLMLAAITATWTAAFSTHALAIRAGSPLLAVLPSVALVGFADTVLDDGARPVYAVTFLLAALGVVFVDGLRRVRQWGPIWSSFRGRRLSSVASRGARQVATLAVLAAVLVPWLLPGFGSAALVDFSTAGDDGIRLDPFVSIQAQLQGDEPVDLFEVTSSAGPAYWRLYALDVFNGTTWSSSDPHAQRHGVVLGSPAVLTGPLPSSSETLEQRYVMLRDIGDPWLPMAHPAETVNVPLSEIRYQPDLASAVVDGGLGEGLEYSVTSRIVAPTGQELDAVSFQPRDEYGRYTLVPPTVDPRVRDIALRWAHDAGSPASPYRQVLAIQQHLRTGYEYSLDVEPTSDADALLDFLTVSRRGFCQQFATAMAILVRELGYPARVAVGFREGTANGNTYLVQSKEAHAWVEVFFEGYGWLPFEPTPGRSNPVAEPGTYLNPSVSTSPGPELPGGEGANAGVGAGIGASCRTESGRPLPAQLCGPDSTIVGVPGRAAGPGFTDGFPEIEPVDERGYSIPYRWILIGLATLAGLLLLITPVAKWVWRRRLLRAPRDPRDRILAVYRVFDGKAADLGLGRREGETLDEHRARLSAAVALSDGHLGHLAALAARAAYAEDSPSPAEANQALRDARTAIGDLRRDAGWVRRIVGTYRPGI